MTDHAREPAPRHYEGTLADMLQSTLWALTDAGIAQTEAEALACRVVDRITAVLGGGCFYIPKNEVLRQMRRNLAMWREFDGTIYSPYGIKALAKKHGVTELYAYRIIKTQRKAHLTQTQPDLPGLTLTPVNSPSRAGEAG